MEHKVIKTIVMLGLSFLLCGCGKDKQLEAYETQMSTFFDHISELDSDMNAIDPYADDAAAQLLACLDLLELEFQNLAALEVPDEFLSAESLADEAADNMTQAVSLYHEVYESESFDTNMAEIAKEYYNRANVRLQYIISILHGEMPEGENVTIVMDDEAGKEPDSPPTEEVIETHGEIQTENPLADE